MNKYYKNKSFKTKTSNKFNFETILKLSSSVPITQNDIIEVDVKRINKTPIYLNEIREYNDKTLNKFISNFPIGDMLDFKTRFYHSNPNLHANLSFDEVMNEYIIHCRRMFRSQFNKLTCETLNDTINFIINNTNKVLTIDEIKELIIERVINSAWIMKPPIFKAYSLLISTLTLNYDFNFNFKFDDKFLKENYNYEYIHLDYENFINNIFCLIIQLYEDKIINKHNVFEFFDAYVLNPFIPKDVNYMTYCKTMYNNIHGLNKGDYHFKPNIIFELFKDYSKSNKQLEQIYINFINNNSKSYLSKMLLDMIINTVNGRVCCEDCQKRIELCHEDCDLENYIKTCI